MSQSKIDLINPVTGEVLTEKEFAFLASKAGKRAVENPDPTPLEPPLGFVKSQPIHLQIRDLIQRELSMRAEAAGFETLEDADDFDIDDDVDPTTPYEEHFLPSGLPQPAPEAVVAAEAAAVGGAGASPAPSPTAPPEPSQAPPAPPAKPA